MDEKQTIVIYDNTYNITVRRFRWLDDMINGQTYKLTFILFPVSDFCFC